MVRKTYILGAGNTTPRRPDIVQVDKIKFLNTDLVHDLEKTPWPIQTGAAIHVNAVHLIEHINDVCTFMDECHRILSPGGTLYVATPDVNDIELAFCDPTHRHFFRPHTFINYFTIEGVRKFGYVKHAWSILHLESVAGVIRCHLTPIEDKFLTDDILKRLNGSLQANSERLETGAERVPRS